MFLKRLHPISALIFVFVFVTISLSLKETTLLLICACCAVLILIKLSMSAHIIQSLKICVPLSIIFILSNLLTNHRGTTVIFSVGYTNFTLESAVSGLNVAVINLSMLLWFGIFNSLITVDRFLFLFAPLSKTIAFSLAMLLYFIPSAISKYNMIYFLRSGLHRKSHSRQKKIAEYLCITKQSISTILSHTLESTLITIDTLAIRGFSRTPARVFGYSFTAKDSAIIIGGLTVLIFVSIPSTPSPMKSALIIAGALIPIFRKA